MNDSPTRYPAPVQRRIDAHLGAIDRVLTDAGVSKADRSAIVGEVEHQVRDTLAERAPGGEPTVADVDAVLAEMDPPQSYADRDSSAPVAAAPAKSSIAGRLSIGLTLLGLALVIVLLIMTSFEVSAGIQKAANVMGMAAMLIFPLALVCGLIGRRSASGRLGAGMSGACVAIELVMLLMSARVVG